jgi:hypothetical protein
MEEPMMEVKALLRIREEFWTQTYLTGSTLNIGIPVTQAAQFAWWQETGSIQSYQHIETGRHIHIDGADGQFYDRHREGGEPGHRPGSLRPLRPRVRPERLFAVAGEDRRVVRSARHVYLSASVDRICPLNSRFFPTRRTGHSNSEI